MSEEHAKCDTNSWCILELLGHARFAGRLSEEEKFGVKMGRLDVPQRGGCTGISASWCPECGDCTCKDSCDKNDSTCALHAEGSRHGEVQEGGFLTFWFGGSSVYRITPVSEAVARDAAKACDAAPVRPWDYPKALPRPDDDDQVSGRRFADEYGDDDPQDEPRREPSF